jgi:hypothetical protein
MATDPANPSSAPLFSTGSPQPSPSSRLAWIVAAAVVVLVVVGLLLASRRKAVAANTVLAPDAYAANVVFTDVVPSEATSLSGGKSTYVDGHVRNTGTRTLAGATVQVLFLNDEAMPPQVETVPLTVIRTRVPYVDTQPVSAAPLGPGEDREFRLIFENIGSNWNQGAPQIHLVAATLR